MHLMMHGWCNFDIIHDAFVDAFVDIKTLELKCSSLRECFTLLSQQVYQNCIYRERFFSRFCFSRFFFRGFGFAFSFRVFLFAFLFSWGSAARGFGAQHAGYNPGRPRLRADAPLSFILKPQPAMIKTAMPPIPAGGSNRRPNPREQKNAKSKQREDKTRETKPGKQKRENTNTRKEPRDKTQTRKQTLPLLSSGGTF